MARQAGYELILNSAKLKKSLVESLCCQELFTFSAMQRLIILFRDCSDQILCSVSFSGSGPLHALFQTFLWNMSDSLRRELTVLWPGGYQILRGPLFAARADQI